MDDRSALTRALRSAPAGTRLPCPTASTTFAPSRRTRQITPARASSRTAASTTPLRTRRSTARLPIRPTTQRRPSPSARPRPARRSSAAVDGGSWTSCSSPETLAALGAGSHTFDVRATDTAGNTDADARELHLDDRPHRTEHDHRLDAERPDERHDPDVRLQLRQRPAPPSSAASTAAAGAPARAPRRSPRSAPAATPSTSAQPTPPATPTRRRRPSPGRSTSPHRTRRSTRRRTTRPTTRPRPSTFSSNETGSTFECRIDSGSWSSCTSPDTLSALGAGSHTFDVRATDTAGNTDATPASFTWTIDLTAPNTTIDSTPNDPTNDTTPTFDVQLQRDRLHLRMPHRQRQLVAVHLARHADRARRRQPHLRRPRHRPGRQHRRHPRELHLDDRPDRARHDDRLQSERSVG